MVACTRRAHRLCCLGGLCVQRLLPRLLLSILALLLLAALIGATTVSAAIAPQSAPETSEDAVLGSATVQARPVSLRLMPDGNAAVVSVALPGDVLAVVGKANECAWLKVITPYGATGWVPGTPDAVKLDRPCAELVATATATPLPAAPAPLTATPAVTVTPEVTTATAVTATALPTATVQVRSIIVYKSPGSGFLTAVLEGDVVEVIDQSDDCAWLQVVTPYAVTGWIRVAPGELAPDPPCISLTPPAATTTKPVTSAKPVTDTQAMTATQAVTATAKPITLPTVEMTGYTNNVHHWTLVYPRTWTVDDVDPWYVKFGDETADVLCDVGRMPLVEYSTLQEAYDSLQEEWMLAADDEHSTFVMSLPQEITLPSGETGLEVTTEQTPGAATRHLLVLTVPTLYWLSCETSNAAWPQWDAIFSDILHSFTLLPQPISRFGDAAAILDQVTKIRANPPTREDTFDADTGSWESYPDDTAHFEVADGEVQLCTDERIGGVAVWELRRFTVEDFYVEIDVINLGDPIAEDEWLSAGLGFRGSGAGTIELEVTKYDDNSLYLVRLFWSNAWDVPVPLANDFVVTPMSEAQDEQLRLGLLVVGDEATLLVDDEVIATIQLALLDNGGLYLLGSTPRGCYVAMDNFRLWKLDGDYDLSTKTYVRLRHVNDLMHE